MAYSFLRAINTDHPGSITTVDADSPAGAVEQLALMVMIRTWTRTMRRVTTERNCQPDLEGEHGEHRVGGHGLPLEGERAASRREWVALADPPQETGGATDGQERRPGQQRPIEGPRAVEHVFARQKGPMALVVRTIGLARATVKVGLANIAYNMRRAVWLIAKRQAAA